jgi:hypothetical protein
MLSSCTEQEDNINNPLSFLEDDILSGIHYENMETEKINGINFTIPTQDVVIKDDELLLFDIFVGDKGESILLVFPFVENLWSPLISGMPEWYVLIITQEFKNLVDEIEFEKWKNSFIINDEDNYERSIALRTDLNGFPNLFSFIYNFNLSEEQIKDAIIESYENRDIHGVNSIHHYSEEDIIALTNKDKAEATRLFTISEALVKNDKYYAPGWFFYASIEEYQDNNITLEDIMFILKVASNRTSAHFADLIEYKTYHYFDGDVDVIKLCGYDRDFSMPMTFEGYYLSLGYERYNNFFDFQSRGIFNIIKSENVYSPHWVYYNKHAAYFEAGITPDELIEMLPRYENLGILSEAAWEALQEKILGYVDYYNSKF